MREILQNGCINRVRSNSQIINSGVPQGSVLGPVLFIIYINDLISTVKFAKICLFADDTSITLSNIIREMLKEEICNELKIVTEWLSKNAFSINTSKTKYLEFSITKKKPLDNLNITVDGNNICSSDNINFLGLYIDKHLNFKMHVQNVSNKISKGLFVLRRLSTFCTVDVLLTVYHALIVPHLVYAVPIWGMASSNSIKIFKLQKWAILIIFNMKRTESCKMYFMKTSY